MLDVLYEVIDFLQLVVFRLRDLVNRILDILHVLLEFLESLLQADGLLLDNLTMLVIHLFEAHELMVFVSLTSEHGALRADRYLACLTVVVEAGAMHLAKLSTILDYSAVLKHGALRLFWNWLRQDVEGTLNLCEETPRHKVLGLQMRTTVWTLLTLLVEPSCHAVFAAELGTFWAENSVHNLTEANEALEDLVKFGARVCLGLLEVLARLYFTTADELAGSSTAGRRSLRSPVSRVQSVCSVLRDHV